MHTGSCMFYDRSHTFFKKSEGPLPSALNLLNTALLLYSLFYPL